MSCISSTELLRIHTKGITRYEFCVQVHSVVLFVISCKNRKYLYLRRNKMNLVEILDWVPCSRNRTL